MDQDDEQDASAGPSSTALFPLLIAVAPSPAERIRLATDLDGVAPLLLVASLDELRTLIPDPQRTAEPAPPPGTPPESTSPTPDTPARAQRLVLDSARITARCESREIQLTQLEHDLLICLTAEPIRTWSYADLHRAVWRTDISQGRANVQSLAKRLRRKLAVLDAGVTLTATRGVGLRLTDHRRPGTIGGNATVPAGQSERTRPV